MIRFVISRLMRHAFMAGYAAALNNATQDIQEMDGGEAWPHYEPEPLDWKRLDDYLSSRND